MKLTEVAGKIAQQAYQEQAQAQGQGAGGQAEADTNSGASGASKDAVDAEFEEVREDDKR